MAVDNKSKRSSGMEATNDLNSSIKYSIFPASLISLTTLINSSKFNVFIHLLIIYLEIGISYKSNRKYELKRSSCATLIVSLIFDSVYL